MAKVTVLFKILPKEVDKGIDRIREEVGNRVEELGCKVLDAKHEEVAFGLKALYVLISMEEKEGRLQEIEDNISRIDDVGSVEVVRVTLI